MPLILLQDQNSFCNWVAFELGRSDNATLNIYCLQQKKSIRIEKVIIEERKDCEKFLFPFSWKVSFYRLHLPLLKASSKKEKEKK